MNKVKVNDNLYALLSLTDISFKR